MDDMKIFVDVFSTVLQIVSLLGTALFGFFARRRQQRRRVGIPPPSKPEKKDWVLISLYIAALACFVLTLWVFVKTQYFPNFVITFPLNGQIIASDIREIEIRGLGAQPGEKITVVVSDGHTHFRQMASGIPSEKGKWVVENVILQTTDFEYSIWAETTRNGTTILTENRIKAMRKDSDQWFRAFIHNNAFLLLVVTATAVGVLVLLIQRGKNQKRSSVHRSQLRGA